VTGIRVADPRWWRITIERLATARADRFVCVSQSVAEYMRRRGFASEKLTVIPNGVELARWKNAAPADLSRLGIAPGRRLMLFVGRLDKQKGLDRFFYELPGLLQELPEHDVLLLGEGPLRSSLESRSRSSGLAERVHFFGWSDDVPAIMQASSLLVLPSRWEGMPNVVLEAMAAGKPVVATQSEGTVELLGLGALKQTVAVGDWTGLRRRIVEVGQDAALAAELGRQNQERAEQFSLDRVAERYQRLYDGLL
jgi:glycosyltransferase involved in cell wall biosynthesis